MDTRGTKDKEKQINQCNRVVHGFLMKNGNKNLPIKQNAFQVDAHARRLKKIKKEPKEREEHGKPEVCEPDCSAVVPECSKKIKREAPENLGWEDTEEQIYTEALQTLMGMSCISFRRRLLSKIIDIIVNEKRTKTAKCANSLANHLRLPNLPEEHVDTCTKNQILAFYSSAYDLMVTHKIRQSLLRYMFMSNDKSIFDYSIEKRKPDTQNAVRAYEKEVVKLEKMNCEKFRITYLHYLLSEIGAALCEGKQFVMEVFMKLKIKDKDEKVECALKNFVQTAFVLKKSGVSPIDVYFQFLSEQEEKMPKTKAKGKPVAKRKGARKPSGKSSKKLKVT